MRSTSSSRACRDLAEHGPAPWSAIPELGDLPAQPCPIDRRDRPVCRSDIAFRILYCLVILSHGRRQLIAIGVTGHPTAEWVARQSTWAFPWDSAAKYLIRDRDRCYCPVFLARFGVMGIRDRPIALRSPWQNGHVERPMAASDGSAWTMSRCRARRTCAGFFRLMPTTITGHGCTLRWARMPRTTDRFSV